ncbi:MAG: RluA family pseudouridine synthase [Mariprofundaceae bacterium]|nr:RluA family pseudouridine synthase [Mariprofundaceae bacterium]
MAQLYSDTVRFIRVDRSASGQRMDVFLMRMFKETEQRRIIQMVRAGEIVVNKRRTLPHYRLKSGDVIRMPVIQRETKTQPKVKRDATLQLLLQAMMFEDSRFLILNKPSGIAVHGGSGLSYGVIEGVRALYPTAPFLELAHRLDRDTSGCLVIAKRRSALRAFQQQQTAGDVDKRYLTLLKGVWKGGGRNINAPLLKYEKASGERVVEVSSEGKRSRSFFLPLTRFKDSTLIQVKLMTGRTHQIRVHAAHSGHPIAGDDKYGDPIFNRDIAALGLNRLFLHAESICFTLPHLDKSYDIHAPISPELNTCLTSLGQD